MVEHWVTVEKELFLWLNSPHTEYLDSVMYLISDKLAWIPYGLVFFALLFYRQKPREILWLLACIALLIFLGDQISSQIFKPFFQRYRPTHHPETMDLVKTVLDYRGGSYGFISGHSTNFFAAATFTALLLRDYRYTLMVYLTVATVAYSRIYLGVHFISDVIPGITLGILLGWGVYIIYRRGRETLLGVPAALSSVPYLKPKGRVGQVSLSLLFFYLALWVFSPVVFRLFFQ